MELLKEVCGVMDAQGFFKNKVFYPREICIKSDSFNANILCDTGLKMFEMSAKDRVTNSYLVHNMVGMSMNSNCVKHNLKNDAKEQLKLLYNCIKSEKRIYVAIRHEHLGVLLDELEIPYIDLQNLLCPSINKLLEKYVTRACQFHKIAVPDKNKLRCAEQKTYALWRWILAFKKQYEELN